MFVAILPRQRPRIWKLCCKMEQGISRVPEKPAWAGKEDLLSRFTNLLINTPFIYAILKHQAKAILRRTAESRGIEWRKNAETLSRTCLPLETNEQDREAPAYPPYYRVRFHAYDEGNLCWEAAYEAESATYAMALRVWPEEKRLGWWDAQWRLRQSFLEHVRQFMADGGRSVQTALDLGCSVGVSTRYLADFVAHVSSATSPLHVYGVDLSPYFLAVARYRQATASAIDVQPDGDRVHIAYVHAQGEALTFLIDRSVDLVTMQFVLHELPRDATQAIVEQLVRITRPGGTIAFLDNNPRSRVIQNLPPALFTLMKSTEPHSDDYYTFDIEAALAATSGIESVRVVESDPRHRTLLCRVNQAKYRDP